MARYTIEDLEILRKKSGVTYEEAVNLLEYHNGSLARSLVDLEKNGKLKEAPRNAGGLSGTLEYLFQLHLQITKGDVWIVNLNTLVVLAAILAAPYVVLAGLILSLLLGYKIRLIRCGEKGRAESIERMLKTARKNVRQTMEGFTQQAQRKESEKPEEPISSSRPASGTTPVNVRFPGGATVDIREDQDGYHEAEIQ